jgi:hypothetical protein
MFASIKNGCQFYYDHLPHDTMQTIGKSALYSFAGTVILVSGIEKKINLLLPLTTAAVAALASLIHALINPLFDGIFGDRKINMFREILKALLVDALTSAVFNKLTTGKVNWIALNLIGPLPLNFLKSYFGLIPAIMDWFDPVTGGQIRDALRYCGLIAEEGSNSIYITCNPNLIQVLTPTT